MSPSSCRIPCAAVLSFVALALVGSVALAGGPSWVVDVNEPFVLDGRVFPADSLTIRHVAALNPSISLSEVWVGERCLGLLQARRSDGEVAPSGDAIHFGRDVRGRLVLVGYASPSHGVRGAFRFVAGATGRSDAEQLVAAK